MEVLKVKNGNKHLVTLVTGQITIKKALVSSSTKMEINMKECGKKIRDMVRELIGG